MSSPNTLPSEGQNAIKSQPYGTLKDGREVTLFTLQNKNGITAKVMNFGATLTSLLVPDKNGTTSDLVLGFDIFEDWLSNQPYFGSTVGRYGNRIAGGQFHLDHKQYSLAKNNEPAGVPCHLHGGLVGFSHVLWDAQVIPHGVQFHYHSKDGEEGYPGDLKVIVNYTLNEENELVWQAQATTNQATPVNLIHHSYWNLSGEPASSIKNHLLTINADRYLPTGADLIPTGELQPVTGTPMDFRKPKKIGTQIQEDFPALLHGNGYDHSWVLNGQGMRLAAQATEPVSGRSLEIFTEQPAVQFYTANYLDGIQTGKNGLQYKSRTAFCLETGAFPNSPNSPEFPNCILRPEETYQHTMKHKFSW